MQSRFGVARFGATRFGFATLEAEIYIGGTDVTDSVLWTESVWIERVGLEPDELWFTMNSTAAEPAEGANVQLVFGDASSVVFGGPVLRVIKSNETPDGAAEGLRYQIHAIDHGRLLDRERVIGRYTGAANTIFASIVTEWTTGFTTVNVDTGGPTIDEITFKYETVTGALTRLAERAGWVWHVDAEKDMHFYDPDGATSIAAATISATSGFARGSMVIRRDGAQVRTRVIVEGKGTVTDAAVAGGATSISVADEAPFAELLSDGYSGIGVINVNEFTYTGTSSGSLTGVPASGAGSIASAQASGSDVNTIVKVNNATAQTARAAVEGNDGVHEMFIRDHRLGPDGSDERGQQELDRWSGAILSGKYRTRDRLARAGNVVTVNLPIGWSESSATHLIQEVVTTWLKRDLHEREVTFAPIRRTLREILNKTKLESIEAS